eukprot:364426-Chlamydomonas_euryale.AAC.19
MALKGPSCGPGSDSLPVHAHRLPPSQELRSCQAKMKRPMASVASQRPSMPVLPKSRQRCGCLPCDRKELSRAPEPKSGQPPSAASTHRSSHNLDRGRYMAVVSCTRTNYRAQQCKRFSMQSIESSTLSKPFFYLGAWHLQVSKMLKKKKPMLHTNKAVCHRNCQPSC